jgi:ERF superfamily
MHRSSESIAALAAALAKAQMVLTNPEKSLTGTVPSSRYDEPGRTFRYAPLSSGLDIVRKALGEHGIATLQTTTIDQRIQTVSLTTVLAHASGEWIASDWPVCALSDMAAPRRMGAALTYARRYALFTLVGIAGEDDLDAPDLGGRPTDRTGEAGNTLDTKCQNGSGADQPLGTFAANRKPWSPPKQPLEPGKSAALRDRLVGEIGALASEEQATAWAQKAMAAKNTLTTGDSGLVEAAFAARLAELTDGGNDAHSESHVDGRGASDVEAVAAEGVAPRPASLIPVDPEVLPEEFSPSRQANNAVAWHVDKGALALSEPRRYRDRAHLRFVSAQPCLICGRRPSDAHHLRFAQPRALGRRVSDEYTVPLCRSHHRALHRCGDEAAWWKTNGVDPIVAAGELWQRTRLYGPRGERTETLRSVGVIESSDGGAPGAAPINANSPVQAPGSAGQ